MIAEHELKTDEGHKYIADLFNITRPIHYGDFFFFYADIFTMGVQYGTRTSMCEKLEAAMGSKDSLMNATAELAKNGGVTYDGYDAVALSDPKIDTTGAGRQWSWQYCTEF